MDEYWRKELIEKGLSMLRGSAGRGKAGDVSTTTTTLEGVPVRQIDRMSFNIFFISFLAF